MLLFLLLTALASSHSAPTGLTPISPVEVDPSPGLSILSRQTQQCSSSRTINHILWSCLTIIFACTWVAIHPNLPGPKDSAFQRLRRQVITMLSAVLAPELLAFWALRQRLVATRFQEEFNRLYNENSE